VEASGQHSVQVLEAALVQVERMGRCLELVFCQAAYAAAYAVVTAGGCHTGLEGAGYAVGVDEGDADVAVEHVDVDVDADVVEAQFAVGFGMMAVLQLFGHCTEDAGD
jgi:hypothetical protein